MKPLPIRCPLVLALCVGAAACGDPTPAIEAPPLPSLDTHGRRCAARGRPQKRAAYCAARARASMDAYGFSPDAGIDAVAWLSEARACYRKLHAEASVAQTSMALAHWRGRLDRDLRTHHLRLQLAIRQARPHAALEQIRLIRALLRGTPTNAYVTWLATVERRFS